MSLDVSRTQAFHLIYHGLVEVSQTLVNYSHPMRSKRRKEYDILGLQQTGGRDYEVSLTNLHACG
jgi:hypothetical protein